MLILCYVIAKRGFFFFCILSKNSLMLQIQIQKIEEFNHYI